MCCSPSNLLTYCMCVYVTIKDIQVTHRPIINGFQIDLESDEIKLKKKITTSAHVSTFRTNIEIKYN